MRNLFGVLRHPGRLAALRRIELMGTPPEEAFDRLTRLAAKILDTPISYIALVDEQRQFFKSHVGLPEPWASQREVPLSHSFAKYPVVSGEPLFIEDARQHPLGRDHPAVPALRIVAYAGLPLVNAEGHALGAFAVIDTQPRVWTEEEVEILRELAPLAMDQIELRVTARKVERQAGYWNLVRVLAAAIETRDSYTGGHVERVSTYAVAIGRELGWDDEQLAILEVGGALHDVGKLGVEDRVLRKPGPLDDEEKQQMYQHAELGARLLQRVPLLEGVLNCARYHQERYDGQGYPDGLAGAAIPIEARVVAVADTFDAMTTDRPYRNALSTQVALAEIERGAGTQFDPEVVAAFVRAARSGAIASTRGS